MRHTISGEISVRYYIGDTNPKILNRLADEIEGICGSDGYILPGTTRFISRSTPFLDRNENGGITRVLVRYEADVIRMNNGDIIEVSVDNVNRLGAMTTYSQDDNVVASVLLPNDLQDDGIPEKLFHGDHVIRIRVLDFRFGVGWDKITAVGKAVDFAGDDISRITEEITIGGDEATSSGEW